MNTQATTDVYKRHRFPSEIIAHGVWLYFRFCLSYRDVEELLLARGVIATYEAIRKWCRKFGQAYANQLRCRRPRPGDTWHLDEVFLIAGGRSIRTEIFSIFWCNGVAINKPRRHSSASCSKVCDTCHVSSSRINWRATVPPSASSYPVSNTGSTTTSITGRKTPTNRRGNENEPCDTSSPPATPSDSGGVWADYRPLPPPTSPTRGAQLP